MDNTNLARLLLDRFRWFDDALLDAIRSDWGIEITSAQSLLFAELSVNGARQSDLARRLGVSRQAVNELVKKLEAEGLLETIPDPESGRAKTVRPTAKGRKNIRFALRSFALIEEELRTRIGTRTVDQLRNALQADWGEPPLVSDGS